MTPAQMESVPRRDEHPRPATNGTPSKGCGIARGRAARHSSTACRLPPAAGACRRKRIAAPAQLPVTIQPVMSTQAGFGALLNELGREQTEIAARIVTTSPDVTVSTNLGAWVNRRGLFARETLADTFKSERIPSTFNWDFSPKGQHIELGIAEMNLFILLSALGLSHAINGERLIPIGTLYDPFIAARARCAQLRLLPGGALHPGGDALGHHARARRRRASIDRDAADRDGAGRACRLRAGIRRRARGDPRLRLRLHPARRRGRGLRAQLAARRDRRLGLSAALDAADRADQARDDGRAARRRSSTAPIGCASPARTARWWSPIPARSRRRRSRRSG